MIDKLVSEEARTMLNILKRRTVHRVWVEEWVDGRKVVIVVVVQMVLTVQMQCRADHSRTGYDIALPKPLID